MANAMTERPEVEPNELAPPSPERADASPDCSSPDWSSPDAPQLVCPLCEYNLRGLTNPRCPECGFAFTWRGLIEQRGLEHPYLFEHRAHRRPVGSFVHTLLAAALPLRFWRVLRPGHEPNVRRLVLFWLIASAIGAAMVVAAPIVAEWWAIQARFSAQRTAVLANPSRYLTPQQQQSAIRGYGSLRAYVASVSPPQPTLPQFLWQSIRPQSSNNSPIVLLACLMLTPAFGAASLFIFRESLRQARLRTIHILRVAVYAWALGVVGTLLLLPLAGWYILDASASNRFISWGNIVDAMTTGGFLLIVVLPAVSVIIASRRYLAIPRAVLTAVLSQLLAILLIGKLTQAWMWGSLW